MPLVPHWWWCLPMLAGGEVLHRCAHRWGVSRGLGWFAVALFTAWCWGPPVPPALKTLLSLVVLPMVGYHMGQELQRWSSSSDWQASWRASWALIALPLAAGVGVGLITHATLASSIPLWRYAGWVGLACAATAVPVLYASLKALNVLDQAWAQTTFRWAVLSDAWLGLLWLLWTFQGASYTVVLPTLLGSIVYLLGVTLARRRVRPRVWGPVGALTIGAAGLLGHAPVLLLATVWGVALRVRSLPSSDARRERWIQGAGLPLYLAATAGAWTLSNVNAPWRSLAFPLTVLLLGPMVIKVSSSWAVARWQGWRQPSWRMAWALNTRGLVELLLLQDAYDHHGLSSSALLALVGMSMMSNVLTLLIVRADRSPP